jgi:DnaK suppressor protein
MMKKEIITKFKALFESQRASLTFSHEILDSNLTIPQEDMADESDLTTTELEASMRMRLRNRETLFAKKIDEALKRIEEGTYGLCEDCDVEIELKRLEARPTATLCVQCKEESEHRELIHIDGHRYKSVGTRLRVAGSR